MPRKHRNRMKGGFLDSFTSWGASLWNKTKNATASLTGENEPPATYVQPSATSVQPPATSYQSSETTETPSSIYGGKSKKRRMKGGLKGYTPTTGLASHGTSFSGPTAKPHTMVGGKTRKRHCGRKHKHSKSCRH